MSTGRNTKKYGPNCGIDLSLAKNEFCSMKSKIFPIANKWHWPACANAQAGQFQCCLLAGGDITI